MNFGKAATKAKTNLANKSIFSVKHFPTFSMTMSLLLVCELKTCSQFATVFNQGWLGSCVGS
jgi:hypothetical protein